MCWNGATVPLLNDVTRRKRGQDIDPCRTAGQGWFTLRPLPGSCIPTDRLNCSGLVLEEIRVLFDELLLIFRNIFERVDRVGSASRNACATVDASLGIYIHLTRGFEAGLIRLGMDAIGRANLNA